MLRVDFKDIFDCSVVVVKLCSNLVDGQTMHLIQVNHINSLGMRNNPLLYLFQYLCSLQFTDQRKLGHNLPRILNHFLLMLIEFQFLFLEDSIYSRKLAAANLGYF